MRTTLIILLLSMLLAGCKTDQDGPNISIPDDPPFTITKYEYDSGLWSGSGIGVTRIKDALKVGDGNGNFTPPDPETSPIRCFGNIATPKASQKCFDFRKCDVFFVRQEPGSYTIHIPKDCKSYGPAGQFQAP